MARFFKNENSLLLQIVNSNFNNFNEVFTLSQFSPAVAVYTIEHVISTIVKASDTLSLKILREVSSLFLKLTTRELQKRTILRLYYDSSYKDIGLEDCKAGLVSIDFDCCSDPYEGKEDLVVMRKSGDPLHTSTEDIAKFSVENLIKIVKRNPIGFPINSLQVVTRHLSSPHIDFVLSAIGGSFTHLNLVLFYFFNDDATFKATGVIKDLKNLLTKQMPHLEQHHLRAELHEVFVEEIRNYDSAGGNNFLHEEPEPDTVTHLLPNLKSFTYSGLLSHKLVNDIREAVGDSIKIVQLESACEYIEKRNTWKFYPLNPYYLQLLERIAGRGTGRLFKIERIYFEFAKLTRFQDCRALLVGLVQEILETHSDTLYSIGLECLHAVPEIKIPSLRNLYMLHFSNPYRGVPPFTLNLKNVSEGKCSLKSKFPKLKEITFTPNFDFINHFGGIH